MKKSMLLVLTFAAALCVAQAPPPPGPARRLSEMPHGGEFPFSFGSAGLSNLMKEAGISEAQMKQIEGILEGSRHTLIDQRAEVEKKEGDFQLLMQAPQIDAAKSEKALDALLDARGKLSKTQTMMMVKMRTVLTQEQWHKMEQMQRRGGPGGGGPGGGPQQRGPQQGPGAGFRQQGPGGGSGPGGGGPGGPPPAAPPPPRPQGPPESDL